jgi:hypothetical protein
MDDPSEEIRRTAKRELLGARSDDLSFICELLKLKKSGSIPEKVDRIVAQPLIDALRAFVVRRQLFFSDLVQPDVGRDVLAEILERYELPATGNRYDMLRVLVTNGKFDPKEILTCLNVQSVKRVYESIFAGHSLLEEDVLRREIIGWVRGEPLASQWRKWGNQPVPVTRYVPLAPTTAEVSETPRPPLTDHNFYPATPLPEPTAIGSSKESPWGPLPALAETRKEKKLTTTQMAEVCAVFGVPVTIGIALIVGNEEMGKAFRLNEGVLFVALGVISIGLGFLLSFLVYRRAKS